MSKETTAVSNKEPLMHISKRDEIDMWKAWAVRLGAVLLSLVVCAGVIYALTGLNPLEVYKGIFDGAVGTKRRTWMTIRDTLVLLCIAIGITPAFKMRFWNIGAEGQVLIGGVTSAAMMIYLGNSLPPLVLFPLAFGKRPVSHGVGSYPGIFQGILEHQRDTVYIDDELCGHAGHHILYHFLGESKGFQFRGNYQLHHKGRMASKTFRSGIRLESGDRAGADPGYLYLSEVQQAGI